MDLSVYNTLQPVFVKFNTNEKLPEEVKGKYMLHLIIPNIKLEKGIPAIYLDLETNQDDLELFMYQVSQDETLLYKGTQTFVRNKNYYLNDSLYEYLGVNYIFYNKIETIIDEVIKEITNLSNIEESIFAGTIINDNIDNEIKYELITENLSIKSTNQVNDVVDSDFSNIFDLIHKFDEENIIELIYNGIPYTYDGNDYISENYITLSSVLCNEVKKELDAFAQHNNLLEYVDSSNFGSGEDFDSSEFDFGSIEDFGSEEYIIKDGTVFTKQIVFNFNNLNSIIFDININCEEIIDDKIVDIITEIVNDEKLETIGTLSNNLNKITDDILVETINPVNVLDAVMEDIMNIVNASESLVNSIYYNKLLYVWNEDKEEFISNDNDITLEEAIYSKVIKEVFTNQSSISDFSVAINDIYFNYEDNIINENEATVIVVNTAVKIKDIYEALDDDNIYYTYLDNYNVERIFNGKVIENEDGTYSGYVNKGYVHLMTKENGTYTYIVNGTEYIYLGNSIELVEGNNGNFVGSVFVLASLVKHSKALDVLEEEEEEDEAVITRPINASLSLPDYMDDTFNVNTEYFDIINWDMEVIAKYFANKNALLQNIFTEEELNNFYSTFCKTILEYTQISPSTLLTTTNQIYKHVLEYYSNFMMDEGSISINLILNSLYGTIKDTSNCGCAGKGDGVLGYNTNTCGDLYKNAMLTYLSSMLGDVNFYKDWFFVNIESDDKILSYPNDNLIDRLITLINEFIALDYDLSFDTNVSHNCNCPVINTDTSDCNYNILKSYIKVLNWVKNNEITENTNKIKIYGQEFSVLLPKLQF